MTRARRGALAAALWPPVQPAAAQTARPNVVLIVTDDVGYGDIGSYGAPDIKTPNIDRLAREGVRFTDFYAAPTCSPTRASLISGRYYQRFRIERPLARLSEPAGDQGLRPTGRIAAAAAEERRLRHRAHRQVAPRLQAGVQPERARLRLLLRVQERAHRLLPAHRPDRRARLLRERRAGAPDRLQHRSVHRSLGEVHRRATPARPFFLEVAFNAAHWPFQVPDHPSVAPDNARFVQPTEDEHLDARRLRRDPRARRSGRRQDPGGARPRAGSIATRWWSS